MKRFVTYSLRAPGVRSWAFCFSCQAALALCLLVLPSRLPGATGLEWQSVPGGRFAPLSVPTTGQSGFTLMGPAQTGIAFTNFLSEENGLAYSRLADGSGVAAGDVDGDGWCDLYFCRLEGPNALYRNLGHWRFEDVTVFAGVACEGQHSTGAVFADVDGDGDLDLLVNSLGGGTRLFLNDGQGRFREATQAGLVRRYGATSMSLADLDGNGTLDLYVCNYATTKIEDRPNARFESKIVGGQIVITAIDGVPTSHPNLTNRYYVDATRTVRERGEPDVLYLNDGHGRFTPVPWTEGAFLDETGQPLPLPPYDFGLSVAIRDLNGDGWPDLYVCNDLFPPDRIWINDGRGHFRACSSVAIRHTSRFTMGIDFADINRDGFDDFFTVDMFSREHPRRKAQTVGVPAMFFPVGLVENQPQYMRNMLQLNRGDGTYAEIAQLAGLEATEWSWMPAFLDVDLDGFEDVLIPTGHLRDSLHADAVAEILQRRRERRLTDAEQRELKKTFYPVLNLRTQAFRNKRDLTFEDKAEEWRFNYVGISQGLCLADLDNDGDLDVIVNRLRDAAGLYRSDTVAPRVAVRLKGQPPNTHGIGARIKLLGGSVPQSQEIVCGQRYLSCDAAARTFAPGSAAGGMSLEVTWRNGAITRVGDVQPNRVYEINQAGARPAGAAPKPQSKPLFADVSHLTPHKHVDTGFNDFEEQPLLARRLSQLGPGVSWLDVDRDGWEDLIIGSGAGGRLAIFRNMGGTNFLRWDGPPLDQVEPRDQTTILGWPKKDGRTVLLAGSSNFEDGSPAASIVRQYDLVQRLVEDKFPGRDASTGPLALADVDGDGTLDLFVGGRVTPRGYPSPTASLLFRGTGDRFVADTNNCQRLAQAGLVSGAVFSDLDGDGFPELILACEWGPIKVFRNEHGRLREVTRELGLDKYLGWWNGVTSGDLDGDGRLDIVASNWGRNTKYQRYREQPLQVSYGEWRAAGTVDQLEAYYDAGLKKVVPACPFDAAKAMPWIAERFATYAAFGAAGVAEILGERMNVTKTLQANWLESTVFLNRGDRFESRTLPIEAQFAPAFGVSVADLDGDGREDVFLSQNFFAVDGDTLRYDAGRGLLLAGDGQGNFRCVPGQESGVKVYGEQRGCAVCDYDGDGRMDLVVTQNGAETKLYHNEKARPGLRVRLRGTAGNPDGIGAVLRLDDGAGRLGPAREIHAGSGYWSQNSVVPVMSAGFEPKRIQVRWPGGKTTMSAVPPGAKEITVEVSGATKRVR